LAAFFKPFAGGGWKNVYRLHNRDEFFRAYSETGQLVMMLQEEVKFNMYFRCTRSISGTCASCHTSRGIHIIALSDGVAGAPEICRRSSKVCSH